MSRRVLKLPSAPSPVSFSDSGSGPAVVLLHGQPGAAVTWERVVAPMGDRARVIAVDRPGYGQTGGPALGLAANAAVIRELLDRLELPRATLVGHSWGGGIALSLAQNHPNRVADLVLVCSVGTRSSVDHLDRILATRGLGTALTYGAFRTLPRLLPLPLTRRLVPGLGALTPDALRDLVGTLQQRRDWRSFVVEQRALVEEIDGIAARLEDVRAPTTVLLGGGDFLLAPEVGRELTARIPNAHCQVAPDAGHVLPLEAPRMICDAVLELAERPRDEL